MIDFSYLVVLAINGYSAYALSGTPLGYAAAVLFAIMFLGRLRFGLPAANMLSDFSGGLLLVGVIGVAWIVMTR